jgi:hypothetical protein
LEEESIRFSVPSHSVWRGLVAEDLRGRSDEERDTEEVKYESEFALKSCEMFSKTVFRPLTLQKLFRKFGDRFQSKQSRFWYLNFDRAVQDQDSFAES